MADYNTAPLREFIIEHFSDQELATFSFDNFRYAYDEFAEGMSKTEKVQRLIESCVRRDELPSLLAALRKERTRLYDAKRLGELVLTRAQCRLRTSVTSDQRAVRQHRSRPGCPVYPPQQDTIALSRQSSSP